MSARKDFRECCVIEANAMGYFLNSKREISITLGYEWEIRTRLGRFNGYAKALTQEEGYGCVLTLQTAYGDLDIPVFEIEDAEML